MAGQLGILTAGALLVLWGSVLHGADSQNPPVVARQEPATQAAKVDTIGKNIPVVYVDYESPRKLSADQIEIVLRAAEETRPKERQVWFVLVLCNSKHLLAADYWNISIYYSPDASSARVRRGQCARISKDFPRPGLVPYVQVSRADSPFGEKLEIPKGPDLPFHLRLEKDGAPMQMEDKDLAELVDFARPIFAKEAGKSTRWEFAPIHGISGDGESFDVGMGWVVANTDGITRGINVRKEKGGFKQVGTMKYLRA
jgi:hypothetical protein